MITDLDSAVRSMNAKSDFEQEFSGILRKYIESVETPKSKGDIRFIENHRMKLWSDVAIALIRLDKGYAAELLASRADGVLSEFDKRFNNK